MNTDAQRRLEDLLDREIDVAQSLRSILAAERKALISSSPEDVQQKAVDKIRLLGTMETLESERRALWGSSQPNSPGIAASVAERWRELLALMAGCRTANEINGQIIHTRQNQVRQLIDIVRGSSSLGTYGPRGKPFATALRALARA